MAAVPAPRGRPSTSAGGRRSGDGNRTRRVAQFAVEVVPVGARRGGGRRGGRRRSRAVAAPVMSLQRRLHSLVHGGGRRVVGRHHVGDDALLVDVPALGREVHGGGRLERAPVGERLDALHQALAEGGLADQEWPGRSPAERPATISDALAVYGSVST